MKRLWNHRIGRLSLAVYVPLVALYALALLAMQYLHDEAVLRVGGEEARIRQTLARSAELVSGLYAGYAACREGRPFNADSLMRKGAGMADAVPAEPAWASAHSQELAVAIHRLKALTERNEEGPARESAFAGYHRAVQAFEVRLAPALRHLRQRLAVLHQEKKELGDRHFWLTVGMILFAGGTFLALGLAVHAFFLRPLLYLEKASEGLATGAAMHFDIPDSIGEFNRVRSHLEIVAAHHKEAVEFSTLITENRETALEAYPFAESNPVSTALAQIRRRMVRNAELERLRLRADAGMLVIEDALRKHGKDYQELCDAFIIPLVKYLKCNSGAIFLLDDTAPTDPFLTLVSSYAYNKKVTSFDKKVRIGEGVVGQAALELQPIHLKEVPESYVIFIPGVGEITPSSVLVLPMVAGHSLQGVIELASFSRFRDDELEFMRRAAEKAATVLDNLRNQKRSAAALNRAESLSAELKKRTLELERQAGELMRTRAELSAANETLETRIAEIRRSSEALAAGERRFLTLLENAAEIITIFESNGSVRFHSPNTERIVGYSPAELSNFFRYVHQEDSAKVRTFFQKALTTPGSTQSVQYKYYRKDGTVAVLETEARNWVQDPAIAGVVANTREITDRVKAELDSAQMTQLQSLTQNLPDLIIRYAPDGRYLFLNPAVERYWGRKPEYFAQLTIRDVGLSQAEIKFWEDALNHAVLYKQRRRTEMILPSIIGDRTMQMETIPEVDAAGRVYSVLTILRDMTEVKSAEAKILAQNAALEAQTRELTEKGRLLEEKNQDITESILYARRIQDAILPAAGLLNEHFSDSFVLYKPRDIVSGDFYWFTAKDKYFYVAVCDCTGHGVPGAFMSLIGYNLLNRIVREEDILEPATILHYLHERMKEALRQNEADSAARDGMDVALCRFERDKKIVRFAGAHRPLWLWHNYDLVEIKGERYGIAGSFVEGENRIYQEQTIKYDVGDVIYLFTDGYVDQFGGKDRKKFTAKRFKEVILRNHHRPLGEQRAIFERAHEEWKTRETGQTDDVLVLGLRL